LYISFNDNGVTLFNANFKSSSISTPTILEGLLLLVEAVLVLVFVSVFVFVFSPSIVVVAFEFEFESEFVSEFEFVDDDNDDDGCCSSEGDETAANEDDDDDNNGDDDDDTIGFFHPEAGDFGRLLFLDDDEEGMTTSRCGGCEELPVVYV
jgi:hypothetical protein